MTIITQSIHNIKINLKCKYFLSNNITYIEYLDLC